MNKFLFALCASLILPLLGNASEAKTGNFALEGSQQPGPLVSFGQSVIDKGQTQVFLFGDMYQGKKIRALEMMPSIVYGLSDTSSVSFGAPFAQSLKYDSRHSRGWEDAAVQLESAIYSKTSKSYSDQATIVGSMTFPTGSSKKNPPTGFGSPTYFIGSTYNHSKADWFGFASYGTLFTTKHHGFRAGDQVLYQAGYGRNIASARDWIYAWMVEFDGTYSWKDKHRGNRVSNSGGNTIFLTPSFWASSEHLIMQLGVGFPVVQHLCGNQRKYNFSVIFTLGHTF